MVKKYNRAGELIVNEPAFAPQGVVFSAIKTTDSAGLSPNSAWSVITPEKNFDPFNWYNAATGRFTPQVPGYYRFSAGIMVNTISTSGTDVEIGLGKNLATPTFATALMAAQATNANISVSGLTYLNGTTDYVNAMWFMGAGITGTMRGTSGNRTWFDGALVASSVGVSPEPWHSIGASGEPAFLSTWANYGSGYQTAGFRKDPNGMTWLRGSIAAGTTPANNVFTLPAGYRPAASLGFPTTWLNSGAYGVGLVTVSSAGVVNVYGTGGGAFSAAVPGPYHINGITFAAEA